MLPSLHTLSLHRPVAPTGTGLRDLPPDLLEKVLALTDEHDPCKEIAKLCALNHQWWGWCRSGYLYDAANNAFGYYGVEQTFEGVQQRYTQLRQVHANITVPQTPKAYFQMACLTRFNITNPPTPLGVPRYHPFYGARLLQQARAYGWVDLALVATDLYNYGDIAKFVVPKQMRAMELVPTDRADYGEIAKLSVRKFGSALKFVPINRADYGDLAKIAVHAFGLALEYVPTDRDDYGAIAKLAMTAETAGAIAGALKHVPTDRDDYGEIAKIAVQIEGLNLKHVPNNRADYAELAKIAVQQNGEALDYVPKDRDDYDEIASLAVYHEYDEEDEYDDDDDDDV